MSGRSFSVLAAVVVLLLSVAACSSNSATRNGTERAPEAIRIHNCEPQTLMPSDAMYDCSTTVLLAVFSGLVSYDSQTNQAVWGPSAGRANADVIETQNNRVWTIQLKEGWTFHNGEPVTAQSYINAWNYAALSTNGQQHSYFFSSDVLDVRGYDSLQSQRAEDGTETPPAESEMSGLRAVDEYTLEVTLNAPSSAFPTMLGYNAFYPMSNEVFANPSAYVTSPIGNGPYTITAPAQPGENIVVERYEAYEGTPGNAETIEFVLYETVEDAYHDVQIGELDVLDDVPFDRAAQVKEQFQRHYTENETAEFRYLVMPMNGEDFADPAVRQALSLGINRSALTDMVFHTQYAPADAFISPVLDGYTPGSCESCVFDPERGKALLAQTSSFDGTVSIISRNDTATVIEWVTAIAQQWEANLGITVDYQQLPADEFNAVVSSEENVAVFPDGWIMDFPLALSYLSPCYETNGVNNLGGYSNDQFDMLVAQGVTANSRESSIRYWQRAEQILSDDMPVIPLFYGKSHVVFSDRVSNIEVTAYDVLDVSTIELTGNTE